MSVRVRACTQGDAEAVAELSGEFVAYLRSLGDRAPRGITAEAYLRDGLGEDAAFSGLLAEANGRAAATSCTTPATTWTAAAACSTSSTSTSATAPAARAPDGR